MKVQMRLGDFEAGLSDLDRANQLCSAEFTRTGYLIALIQATEFARYASRSGSAS
jgi:hypothetical protein